MRAVWTMSWSYLKRSKLQSLFIALLILLSVLLMTTAVLVLANTGRLYHDTHERVNGAHEILTMTRGLHDPVKVQRWWESDPGVQASSLMRYRTLPSVSHEGKDLPNLYLFMMETPEEMAAVDEKLVARGESAISPTPGTVWVPTSMAYSHQIEVGDMLQFQGSGAQLAWKVSAIVVDLPYGAPFSNTSRIWVSPADYEAYLAALPGEDQYMTALRFEDYSTHMAHWERFEQHLGEPYQETRMTFEEISSFYLIIQQIVGFLMIFLGVVMMMIALLTIGFTISDAILAQYRTIGVLQSFGLGSRRLTATYVIQYGLLTAVAIPPALALGTVLARLVTQLAVSSLQTDQGALRLEGMGLAFLVCAVLFGLTLLVTALYARRARRVQPVQAIRYGMSEEESGRRARRLQAGGAQRLSFGRLPVALVIGIRHLFKNRRGAAMMLILSTLASAVLVLGAVLLSSIAGVKDTAAQWGYDDADIAALVIQETSFSPADFESVLQADDRILSYGWQSHLTGVFRPGTLPGSSEPAAGETLSIQIGVLDGDYEALGFTALEGDNPRHPGEIAIGVSVARALQKSVGDTVDVYIEGKRQTMLVSGIYQAISNMSYSARLTISSMQEIQPDYTRVELAFIQVRDGISPADVAASLHEQFRDTATVVTQQELLDAVFQEAAAVLVYPMGLLGLLFVAVTFIIIYSTCRINIRLESRTYGIYKSIGLTSARIRGAIALGISMLAILGAALGTAIGIYLLPMLLELILSGYGLVDLPLVVQGSSIVVVTLLSVLSAVCGSWLSSGVVKETSPRMLVTE